MTSRWRVVYWVLGLALLAGGCAAPSRDVVFQTSTIDALLAGVFDGDLTCGDLLRHGDFGIGTFDGLDGEMVLLDGRLHQVKADGRVYTPEPSVKTPFATVCWFRPDLRFPVKAPADFRSMEQMLDRKAPNQNLFCAIRLTGQFKSVRTRSVPKQVKPYPTLKEATRQQPEFPMENLKGTIVGFRCPAYVKGVNVPGYHLHFLSDDNRQGGHVLGFELARGLCEVDVLDRLLMRLPRAVEDFSRTDLSRDRAKELQAVER